MRIVIAGASGQVARALMERGAAAGLDVAAYGRPQLDLTDAACVDQFWREHKGDVLINAAAYTAVDQAEDDAAAAYAVNAQGAGWLATAAARTDTPIIQLSTDYVFDGSKAAPYDEEDTPAPLGVYGRTKLEGEQAVALANARHVILRTAWVYSPFGKNFVKTMLRLASERDEVGVVDDQYGCPTAAFDIADGVIAVARRLMEGDGCYGVFHMAGHGQASWADLAQAVFEASAGLGGPTARLRRIMSADYPTPSARPKNSRLCCARLLSTYGVSLPDWRASVHACVERINQEGTQTV